MMISSKLLSFLVFLLFINCSNRVIDKPANWPLSLWKACWKETYLDFTIQEWSSLSCEDHKKYAHSYQQWYAQKRGTQLEMEIKWNKVSFKMVLIAPGKFWMGESDQKYEVLIQHPFWLGKYEVTQKQWYTVTGEKPWIGSSLKDKSCYPASCITWDDLEKKFLPKLKGILELPPEVEWEYACKAGTVTKFFWGKNSKEIDKYAWHASPHAVGAEKTDIHEVGKKEPNAWLLYDMIGNTLEWTHMWNQNSYKIETHCPVKIARGGCYLLQAEDCNSINRFIVGDVNTTYLPLGLRVYAPFKYPDQNEKER